MCRPGYGGEATVVESLEKMRTFRDEHERVRRKLDRSFREAFEYLAKPVYFHKGVWRPPTDVVETPEAIVIKMEIAGTCKDDISITVEAGMLVIRGRRPEHPPLRKVRVSRMEIEYGDFEQLVYLPSYCDEKNIEARYDDGFLMVVVPKRSQETKETRSVPVTEE